MTILTPTDFRSASLAEYCSGLTLTQQEASDTNLTASIAAMTQWVYDLCNDSFEQESLTDFSLDGDGTYQLILPKRCTAITTLKTKVALGTTTTQVSTAYRLHSSLNATGDKRLGEFDYLEVMWDGTGLVGVWNPFCFDKGVGSVLLTGTFGWTVCPAPIKRAVALLVFDRFKPMGSNTMRAVRWQTTDAAYDQSNPDPTGIMEADVIIKEYKRQSYLGIV